MPQLIDLPGAIGGTDFGVAPTVSGVRTVNLIAEPTAPNSKSGMYYSKTPGLSGAVAIPFASVAFIDVNGTTIGSGIKVNGTVLDPSGYSSISVNGTILAAPTAGTGVQAGVYINGRRFFIVQDTLIELTGSAVPFGISTVGPVGPCVDQYGAKYVRYSLGVNIQGNQLLIASNNVTSLFNLKTSTFTPSVTTPEPLLECDEQDGYFLGLASASGNFYISAFQDGTTWNPLDFVFEETPDLTMGFKVCNRRIWMFGSQHAESYVDSGDPNFPFTRDASVYIEAGAYRNSLVIADDTIFGIAVNTLGSGWAFRLQGTTFTRVSTYAVETSWQAYPTVRDVIPVAYQENGHSFVVWHFPSGNASWALDLTTGLWAERGVFNAATGNWDRQWSSTHVYDANLQLHFAGDYRNSSIYFQSQQYGDFSGTPIKWMRRFPHINSDGVGVLYDLVRLIMQTGHNGTLPAGQAGTVTLQKSNDGGETFGAVTWPISTGAAGSYNKRLDWTQLGWSRDRVFQLSGSDPGPLAIVALKGSVRSCFT